MIVRKVHSWAGEEMPSNRHEVSWEGNSKRTDSFGISISLTGQAVTGDQSMSTIDKIQLFNRISDCAHPNSD